MAENGTTIPHDPAATEETLAESKGKGKAVAPQDAAMDEDDDDEDEEDEDEDVEDDDGAGGDEDGMEEIDLNNIVDGGRRTRGQVIDYAKAAAENPPDDDEDEDDDDFEPADEDHKMSG